jgi:predicted dehydrogenase
MVTCSQPRVPLTLGIVGVGSVVRTLHLPLLYTMSGVRVAYLADVAIDNAIACPFSARAIRIASGGRLNLPQTDIVFVATPPRARSRYVDASLRAGAAIFTEKPFATSLAEHKDFIRDTPRIACNYNRRWFGNILQLKEIITGGVLGQLHKVVIRESAMARGTGKPPSHYQFDKSLSGGGILTERGCHTLSQLDCIFEEGSIVLMQTKMVAIKGLDVDVELDLAVSTQGAEPLEVNYRLGAGRLDDTQSSYFFANGVVEFDHTNPGSALQITDSNGGEFTINPKVRSVQTITQSFYQSWSVFLNKVRGVDSFDAAADTSLRTTRLIADAYEQAALK